MDAGSETGRRIGTFVEIQRGAEIGAACKIQSHTFICDGVTIEDEVFIGHGVMFVNDRRPRATAAAASCRPRPTGRCSDTVVEDGASIGTGATILGGVRIGRERDNRRRGRRDKGRRAGGDSGREPR